MESASESEKCLASKSTGKVLRYAERSACRVEQRRHSQQFGVDPPLQDLSIEAVGE
jgi:hypothetical protein